MNSVLLRAAVPYIMTIQFTLSIFFLIRGHNLTGGGFIAALIFSSAFILHLVAFNLKRTQRILRVPPQVLILFGLFLALLSSFLAPLISKPYMTGLWLGKISLPGVGELSIGSPFLFDIGVYFVVAGMVVTVAFSFISQKNKTGG